MNTSGQVESSGAQACAASRRHGAGVAAVGLVLAVLAGGSGAQALFQEPTGFKVTTPCKAFKGIHSRQGAVRVRVGQTYQAFGENTRAGGTHAYIATPGSRRWVPLRCGEYEAGRPPFSTDTGIGGQSPGGSGGADSQACLPFFDQHDNPVKVSNNPSADITPPPPVIDGFGQAVNQLCGPSGKTTGRTEFVKLMKAHPEVLADLMHFTEGRVFGGQPTTENPDAYLQDLVKAWYDVHAFDHIFCGETEIDRQIGGLHYHGRYQQLQQTGEACRQPNFSKNEVVPGSIYSMGVRMKKTNGRWISHDIKGYGLTFSAADILKIATRAFAENPTASSQSTACLQQVTDGEVAYTTVFVRRKQGIRTFYPDATPDTAGTRPCRDAWALD